MFIIWVSNISYFEYLTDYNLPYLEDYKYIYTFVGDDAKLYYNLDPDVFLIVLSGLSAGQVSLGSVMSLIGITAYVTCTKILPFGIFFNVVITNFILFSLSLKFLAGRLNIKKDHWIAALLFPLTLNYLLIPNKEFFSLLFLLIAIGATSHIEKFFKLLPIFLFREVYAAIFVSNLVCKKLSVLSTIIALSIVIPLLVPDSYFDLKNYQVQKSSSITDIANFCLAYPLLSLVGFFLKILLGLFSGLIISINSINIVDFQLFIISSINLIFFFKILTQKSFRTLLIKNYPNVTSLITIFLIWMSMAPGNPARFLGPICYIFTLLILLDRRRKCPKK